MSSVHARVICGVAAVVTLARPGEALDFSVRQIADETKVNREPVVSDTGLAAWVSYDTNGESTAYSDIGIYYKGETKNLTKDFASVFFGSIKPDVYGDHVVWVANYRDIRGDVSWVLKEVPGRDEPFQEIPASYRAEVNEAGEQVLVDLSGGTNAPTGGEADPSASRRHPSGDNEIAFWPGSGDVIRVSTDARNDFAPSVWGDVIAYQKAKGWPFGWEIMLWVTGATMQVTTNYHYDMAPKVHGRQIVWYGWDGHDFEIYMADLDKDATIQVTSNRYDDVSPVVWDGAVAWEGYAAAEGDIFLWKEGQITKLSKDNIEDDINPRIWNGMVVWQGFDGDDFEIYFYDGNETRKITQNSYDDINPSIRDGLITWMAYVDNYDAEVFVSETSNPMNAQQLTDNDTDDKDPHTAGRRVVWSGDREGATGIYLAEPK